MERLRVADQELLNTIKNHCWSPEWKGEQVLKEGVTPTVEETNLSNDNESCEPSIEDLLVELNSKVDSIIHAMLTKEDEPKEEDKLFECILISNGESRKYRRSPISKKWYYLYDRDGIQSVLRLKKDSIIEQNLETMYSMWRSRENC
jgi:hypothetical protein